jgi:glycosyltransferase involved in cell wall biosynthesis
MTKKKLAIITTHPIQYNAPLFKLLTERNRITVKVFYTWGKTALENKFDPGFGKIIDWDIPLLDGYDYEFLENVSDDKGSHRFRGIINPDIINRIDAFGPDAILVYGWAFQSHLKVLRHYNRIKLILFRGDSTILVKTSFFKSKMRTILLKWIYKHIDYALYVGKSNFDYFTKAGLAPAKLLHAPHAIDITRFSEQSEERELEAKTMKNALGLKKDEIVFLYAGKLEEVKNIGLLLNAFRKSDLGRNVHLLIVGNGHLEKNLKEGYKDLPTVHFLDFQNQTKMPVIYRIGDVFILPSKSETWGLAVNEAMACGRPVIVSDHCGCFPELVLTGKNGYVFRSENENDLIEKMRLITQDNESLKEMGRSSLEHISEFSFESVCTVLEDKVMLN